MKVYVASVGKLFHLSRCPKHTTDFGVHIEKCFKKQQIEMSNWVFFLEIYSISCMDTGTK